MSKENWEVKEERSISVAVIPTTLFCSFTSSLNWCVTETSLLRVGGSLRGAGKGRRFLASGVALLHLYFGRTGVKCLLW